MSELPQIDGGPPLRALPAPQDGHDRPRGELWKEGRHAKDSILRAQLDTTGCHSLFPREMAGVGVSTPEFREQL
jgi:hypothetical protein